jgi:signal transduction histidine kinase
MTNIIRDDVTQWRQLCQTAVLELEPAALLQRVVEARSAVFNRIEDIHSKPITGEQHELRDALRTLSILQELAERDIGELKKTAQSRHLDSISQRAHRLHSE